MQTRRKEFHGFNAEFLYQSSSQVYSFNQLDEIKDTSFKDGLCLGFTASLMRRLLAGDYMAPMDYKNPLPKPLLVDAIHLTQCMIKGIKDGGDPVDVIFSGAKVKKFRVNGNEIPIVLQDSKAATLFYQTKSGASHSLLFFSKSPNLCVIQDTMRFTVDNVEKEHGISALQQIVERSKPDQLEIAFIPTRRARL